MCVGGKVDEFLYFGGVFGWCFGGGIILCEVGEERVQGIVVGVVYFEYKVIFLLSVCCVDQGFWFFQDGRNYV